MIPQETIERVRESTDIVEVIGQYVRLRRRGRNWEGLCPFHTEKTPSFKVSPDKQIYHCFGCGRGGNVFTFLMEHETMTFVEAVRHLAERAGIPIRDTRPDSSREELERLHYAHQVALEYFRRQLQAPRYRRPLEAYLYERRGLTPETVETFQIGFSGESRDGLLQYARSRDLTPDIMVKAGLAGYSQESRSYYDRFRYRLMIPIFNLSWKPIAFGGRTLKKGEPAKYVNSPETPLYHKSNVLYGLNFARDAIRGEGAVIVVEGYFDVISLWQAGVRNVVASSGTSFTPQQARLLARFAEEVYLFYDADSAGQQAALRSVDALYDAGLEVHIMLAPSGEDPDTVVRKAGRDGVKELQQQAVGFIPFRLRQETEAGGRLITREKLVKELRSIGARIGDSTRRALFYREAAEALQVDPQLFTSSAATGPARDEGIAPPTRRLDEEFLSVLLNMPGVVDEAFERVSPEDFESPPLSRLYSAMVQQYRTTGRLDTQSLIAAFGEDRDMVSLLTAVAAREWDPEHLDAEARQRMNAFIERNRKRIRERLRRELEAAEQSGDHERATHLLEELKAHGL